mgnify:CR=1 FL=1
MDDLKWKSCCFTGHRKLPNGQRVAIMAQTEAEIKEAPERRNKPIPFGRGHRQRRRGCEAPFSPEK